MENGTIQILTTTIAPAEGKFLSDFFFQIYVDVKHDIENKSFKFHGKMAFYFEFLKKIYFNTRKLSISKYMIKWG